MPYVKLDAGILDSTLWLSDSDVRVVFITMLAMAKSDGMCEATAPGIARRANLSIEAVRSALKVLEAPDEDSRSLDQEGRRVARIDGGYFIVNYEKYRQKDYTATERKRRERAKRKADESRTVTNVTRDTSDVTPPVTQAEAEAEEKNTSKPDGLNQYDSDFLEFWNRYPRKENKLKAAKAWKRLTKAKKGKALADCQNRYQHTEKQFTPLPTTYIHGERWEDEIPPNAPDKEPTGGEI